MGEGCKAARKALAGAEPEEATRMSVVVKTMDIYDKAYIKPKVVE